MDLVKLILKRIFYFAIFVSIVILIAQFCTIHDKDVIKEVFTNPLTGHVHQSGQGGVPKIIALFNTEYFMSFVFCATIGVYLIVMAILWHYHEVPLHHVKKHDQRLAQIVFGLSICGLIIDHAWWIVAIIIAFMPWDYIAAGLSNVIHRGMNGGVEIKKLDEESAS